MKKFASLKSTLANRSKEYLIMQCYHPNVALIQKNKILKKNGELGSKILRIVYCESPEFKNYEYYIKENERLKKEWNSEEEVPQYVLIPCRHCIGCKANERRNWALRIEKECAKYKNNYFLTLTYNPENLVIPEYMINELTGEKFENPGTWKGTLVKKHASQFIKSFRNYLEREYGHTGLKFYMCGEYGKPIIGERPHYHIILMNCPDLKPNFTYRGRNPKTGLPKYTDERITKIWRKGYIEIGDVNWKSISYVAGYTNKKLFGELKHEYYARKGQIPIYANMSRKPGIGREFFEDNKYEIYACDEIINGKGQSMKPPRYFDKLMEMDPFGDIIQEIKENRAETQKERINVKMSQTNRTIKEQLEIEERTALDNNKKYNRERI